MYTHPHNTTQRLPSSSLYSYLSPPLLLSSPPFLPSSPLLLSSPPSLLPICSSPLILLPPLLLTSSPLLLPQSAESALDPFAMIISEYQSSMTFPPAHYGSARAYIQLHRWVSQPHTQVTTQAEVRMRIRPWCEAKRGCGFILLLSALAQGYSSVLVWWGVAYILVQYLCMCTISTVL